MSAELALTLPFLNVFSQKELWLNRSRPPGVERYQADVH